MLWYSALVLRPRRGGAGGPVLDNASASEEDQSEFSWSETKIVESVRATVGSRLTPWKASGVTADHGAERSRRSGEGK